MFPVVRACVRASARAATGLLSTLGFNNTIIRDESRFHFSREKAAAMRPVSGVARNVNWGLPSLAPSLSSPYPLPSLEFFFEIRPKGARR